MGVYLVSPDISEWRADLEGDPESLAARVDRALIATGHPRLALGDPPFAFEEKLYRDPGGLAKLLGRQPFVGDEADVFVPVEFAGVIHGEGPGVYQDRLHIVSSERLLRQARELASRIELPDEIPAGDNLEIGMWFEEIDERGAPLGRWRRDLDAAFYVAVFLRGAEHSVRYRVPLTYS